MMGAKEYLRTVRSMDSAVDAVMAQIASLESDLEKITPSYDAAYVSGGAGDREAAIARLIDARRKCNDVIDAYVDRKAEALGLINRLHDADCLKVLTLVYIKGLSWEELADEMGYSVRQVQRLHGEALIALEKVMTK